MRQSNQQRNTMTTPKQTQGTDGLRTLGSLTMIKGISGIKMKLTALAKAAAITLLTAGVTLTASATEISYYHTDHLGTPKAMTDSSGTVVWQASHDAFGKATVTTETVTNNLRFPGQYFDQETNLHYNYFRTYDPNVGRYITSDPRGLLLDFSDPMRQLATVQGLQSPRKSKLGYLNHTYNYVDGNPVVTADPTGEFGLGGAIGGGAANLFIQLSTNLFLTDGDIGRSLRCINLTDVLVSAAIGAIAPSLLTNVLRGKPGPSGLTQGQNAYLYLTKAVPAGYTLKKGIPDIRVSDYTDNECDECSELKLTSTLSEIIQ